MDTSVKNNKSGDFESDCSEQETSLQKDKPIESMMKMSSEEKMNMMLVMMMDIKKEQSDQAKAFGDLKNIEKTVIKKVESAVMSKTKDMVSATQKKVEAMQQQINHCVKSIAGHERQQMNRKVVIKNMQEGKHENVLSKVNGLIKEGLRL